MLDYTIAPLVFYWILISALLVIFIPLKLWQLWGSSNKILPGHPGRIKALSSFGFLLLQLFTIVQETRERSAPVPVLLSGIASLIAALGLCLLSFIEHRRSTHPSSSVSLYLLAYLAGDMVLAFVPGGRTASTESQNSLIARSAVALAFLTVENHSKQSILKHPYDQISAEETSGTLGEAFFWWINPILKEGYRSILINDDLPQIDGQLDPNRLRKRILNCWDRRDTPENSATLPIILLKCLIKPFMSAIIPRLFLILFRYSQAILINTAIRFATQDSSIREKGSNAGALLVMASIIVYVGMAVSTAIYQHRLNRMQVMIRGALVTLIYHRSLNVKGGTHENGNAVTLMSNDVSSLQTVGEMAHETWAQILEVLVGTGMLASQIGWVFPVPLAIIVLCSRMSRYVATHLKSKQKNWSTATQERIAMTASMLGSARSMKMLGMAGSMITAIQNLRRNEINMAKKLRWMMVAYNASANALGIFSPVLTISLFAILSKYKGYWKLETETIFTTTAVLTMVTHPANMVMTIIPRAIASMGNFERVQNYLLESSQEDSRLTSRVRIIEPGPEVIPESYDRLGVCSVQFSKVTIQNLHTAKATLQDITFTIPKRSIVMCTGSVGSGKTTLAKAILGEISPSAGTITLSTRRIAFCSQVSWLPSGTIKEAICGKTRGLGHSQEWYNAVLNACSLIPDLEALPDNDQTQIGSRGHNLSGGQRQRIALARAIYARCELLVLDDSFSALDGKTESQIVESLLSSEGLFRKMGITLFLITHSTQYFPLADQIILLGNGTIVGQGKWKDLRNNIDQVSKITLENVDNVERVTASTENLKLQGQLRVVNDAEADLARNTGDIKLYNYYLKSVGAKNVFLLLSCTAGYAFCLTFSQYWLKMWSEAGFSNVGFYVGGYMFLTFVAWATTSIAMWVTSIRIASDSGFLFHQKLLEATVWAPLSYYSNNEIGVMLNRFSQDIQLVDTQLAVAFNNVCVQALKLLVQVALLLAVQSIVAITLPFCMASVYFLQKIYLRTSRQLRFIELESRSAMYSSFLETTEGLATIRAFGWQEEFESENTKLLEISQRPFYILFCLQRWLNIVLDLIVACIAVGVISLAVALKGSTTGASIGVALNLILVTNTTLLRLIENWTNLEISLGAVSRLRDTIENTPREDKPKENVSPPKNWPSEGALELRNVSVSYNSTSLALKSITLKINAGQKVVICGRTGSGKSTLLLTLLHLLDLQSGTIKIDGLDLSRIPRSILRQRCFIAVPQDPFIFTNASLRFNLDQSGFLPDHIIMTALKKTRLWEHFANPRDESEQDKSTTLDIYLSSIPPLSPGQLQLLSLSRAILRKESASMSSSPYGTIVQIKPILLLDEATSSLDPQTESVIQDVIQEEFTDQGHTVIIVAHRISALVKGMRAGRDAVVWMKDGRVERVGGVEELDSIGMEVGMGSRSGSGKDRLVDVDTK